MFEELKAAFDPLRTTINAGDQARHTRDAAIRRFAASSRYYQVDIAAHAGVSRQYVSKLAAQARTPPSSS